MIALELGSGVQVAPIHFTWNFNHFFALKKKHVSFEIPRTKEVIDFEGSYQLADELRFF